MSRSFPFSDLHSFKDYVVWAQTGASTSFRVEDWAGPDDQMTLDRAFEGLRLGLKMAREEKGNRPEFAEGLALVEESYAHYREGQIQEGFIKLEQLQKLLRRVPSH